MCDPPLQGSKSDSCSAALDGLWDSVFLTWSHVMLMWLVCGPHFEQHVGETSSPVFFITLTLPHSQHSDIWCVGFPPPGNSLQCQLGALQFNSVLTLSTRRKHPIPQGKDAVRWVCLLHTSDAHNRSPGYHNFCLTWLQIRGSYALLPLGFSTFFRAAHRTQGNMFTRLVKNMRKDTDE